MSSSLQLMMGEGASSSPAVYIEDVFNTTMYTGTGAANNKITNDVNLSSKGGLVWTKNRNTTATNNYLYDTARGANKWLVSNDANIQTSDANSLTSFNIDGFTLGSSNASNQSGTLNVAWTFRKQPKFFDIVTYTGNGTSQTISHNLGAAPGFMIIKSYDTGTTSWAVYHRSIGATKALFLQLTNATTTNANYWQNTDPTSTNFTVGLINNVNQSGSNYVAYLFAHDAGGFGLSGSDSVVSCGSYTGNGSTTGPIITLGYEPQLIITKRTDTTGAWYMMDVNRGMSGTVGGAILNPNTSGTESGGGTASVLPTGFQIRENLSAINAAGGSYIYIAIRRGPMKPTTDATKVFQPIAYTGTNVDNRLVTTNILTDMTWARIRNAVSASGFYAAERMLGDVFVATGSTAAEATDADSFMTPTLGYGNSFSSMNGFGVGNDATRLLNQASTPQLAYAFKRTPGFLDIVQYSGTGANQNITHALGVVPELMIVKNRTTAVPWVVYVSSIGPTGYLTLNATDVPAFNSTIWANTSPTSSVFTVGSANGTGAAATSYIAYLFASCAGVSKVGTYSGNASLRTIDCGFAGGARFVLIKRTDSISSANWYVWDTARGMVSGTDPYITINGTAAESNADSVYSVSTGFQILASPNAPVNVNGASYIYFAIA